MTDANEVDYAAIITIELPGMDRPATVTLTLKPPDAVEVAPGQVKPLRECTLSDLQAFADALEAELWERYQAMTLTQLAATEDAALKITILGEAEEPLSAARERWLEQATSAEDGDREAPGGEGKAAAPQTVEETDEEADRPDKAPAETGPETGDAEDESASPAETDVATQEAADRETVVDEKDAGAPPTEKRPGVDEDETATDPPETEAPAVEPATEPVETPVVEGAEPKTAPAAAPPTEDGVRVAGLRRPPGHPTPAAADILINESAFRETQEHALSSLNREVAGMLVGPQPEKQPDGRYLVHITDVIAAKHTRMSGASVTYTPESWRYVTDMLDERYPDGEAVIVGWYHTHPGFGIFLSGMDLFIHQNFFTQAWHVALVLDPQAERSGFFCWNRQQTAVQPYEFPWPRWAAGSW